MTCERKKIVKNPVEFLAKTSLETAPISSGAVREANLVESATSIKIINLQLNLDFLQFFSSVFIEGRRVWLIPRS